ncbi:phosphonate C-P lyase system protein PhnH [Lysinibacillus sp. PLM2]|nr:phosphonate C-P lyase system protein PhnH [Lysinibacillus sp. PLM2]
MAFHHTQKAFRTILDALSFPGKINQLDEGEIDMESFNSKTALVCETLLDSEVTFHVIEEEQSITHILRAFTGSHLTDLNKADYVIIPQETSIERIINSLSLVKIGNLANPHKSATIIFEVDSLLNGYYYELTGPGIKIKTELNCTIHPEIIEKRREINVEYPLGIDFILIDSRGNVVGIPRTTQITEVM